ncbi:uncharacterized protein TNCV_4751421 [Trichonephila clavipes]|nr:uncharacterized protein TNCV_4751421 [Trichonephila clavipes]
MLLVSSPLHSSLCALLLRQDLQPKASIEQWNSRRSTAPETHTVKRALHSPFTDVRLAPSFNWLKVVDISINVTSGYISGSFCRAYKVAAVAEWYRYRTVACFFTGSSPVPLKTRRVGKRCTLNLSRAETSSRWCGVVVRRGRASSGVVHVT